MAIMHKNRFFAKKKIMSEKIGKAHQGRVGRWRTGRGRVVRSGFVGSLHSGATWCWCLVSRPLWCTRCHQRSPRCSWLLPGQHQTGTSSGDGRRGGARLGPPAQRQAAAAPRDLGGGRGGRGGGGLESSWQQQRWHWLSTFSCNHRWARWAELKIGAFSYFHFFLLTQSRQTTILMAHHGLGSKAKWTLMIVNTSWESIRKKREIAPGGTRKPLITETDNFYNKILTHAMHFLWKNARCVISKSQWQLKT